MTVYLMCGLAFAGKSTLAAAMAAQIDAAVVSLDEINARRGLAGGDGVAVEEWARSHQTALQEAETVLRRGRSVVVDDTNCFRFLRDDYRALASRLGVSCCVVYLEVPLSVIRDRRLENDRAEARQGISDSVLQDLLDKFEAPEPDETVLCFPAGADPLEWAVATFASGRPQRSDGEDG